MACDAEKPACRASTPNERDSTNPTTAYGIPSRTPGQNESRTTSN